LVQVRPKGRMSPPLLSQELLMVNQTSSSKPRT
jgi:hypothetical protein